MNRLSATTWIASIALHGLVVLPFVTFASGSRHEVYDEGTGNDAFRMDKGITIDMVSFGDAAERIEIAEVAPAVANPTPPPIIETKPVEPELKEVIASTQSSTEVDYHQGRDNARRTAKASGSRDHHPGGAGRHPDGKERRPRSGRRQGERTLGLRRQNPRCPPARQSLSRQRRCRPGHARLHPGR